MVQPTHQLSAFRVITTQGCSGRTRIRSLSVQAASRVRSLIRLARYSERWLTFAWRRAIRSTGGTYLNFTQTGAGTDTTNWKKVADVTIGTGLYKALALHIRVKSQYGNFGNSTRVTFGEFMAAFYRSSNVQDNINNASLVGYPMESHELRIIKTATGVYEVQIKQKANYRDAIVEMQVLSTNGGVITVPTTTANGSTTGTVYSAVNPDTTGDTQTHTFGDVQLGTVKAQNGAASGPSYTFGDDTNTGMFRYAADSLGFATGGVHRGLLNSTGFSVNASEIEVNSSTNNWKYLRFANSGAPKWDIATKDDDLSGALQFRPSGLSTNRTYMSTGGDWTFAGTVTTPYVRVTGTGDASLSSTTHGIQVGATSGQNLLLDNNEVLSRNNGAASTLHLQADGGTVTVGAGTTANLTVSGTVSSGAITATGNSSIDRITLKASSGSGTGGGRLLDGYYTGDDHLWTLSSDKSSGALTIGYGAESATSGAQSFDSTFDNFSGKRSAVSFRNDSVRFWGTSANVQTTVGSQLTTMTNRITLHTDNGEIETSGTVKGNAFSVNGTTVLTSGRVLQNVTANANIITAGTLNNSRLNGDVVRTQYLSGTTTWASIANNSVTNARWLDVVNTSASDRPTNDQNSLAYAYGTGLSFNAAGRGALQIYTPEQDGASNGGMFYRTGWNGTLRSWQRVFDDEYHPNADKWTTGRTHTVTLTGQVTGTASQTVDGSANKTWTIATTLTTVP